MDDVSGLLRRVQAGDQGARDRLSTAAFSELRHLARSRLQGGGRNTFLATTALVHETDLKYLSNDQLRAHDRRAFFAYASKVMRSVFIDSVRERKAERRGGDVVALTLDTTLGADIPQGEEQIVRVHEALAALEDAEPRLTQVVKIALLRWFCRSRDRRRLGTERGHGAPGLGQGSPAPDGHAGIVRQPYASRPIASAGPL